MKRKSLFFVAAIVFVAFITIATRESVVAQKPQEKEKVINFSLTASQAQVLFYVIDKSTAEHTLVGGMQAVLGQQYQAQMKDTATIKKLP